MAWIEFHGSRIVKLQKFVNFRRELQWSVNEALGFLGSLWSEVIELREDGDISGWTPDYVCELTHTNLDPQRVWDALVNHGWLDMDPEGVTLVHDWPDAAGMYLRGKYHSSNRERLIEIWAKYGRVYGKEQGSKQEVERKQIGSLPNPTLPNQTKPKQPSPKPAASMSGFVEFWQAYPKKVGKDKALEAWKKKKPPLDAVLKALTWQIQSDAWRKEDGAFIPHPTTYLNQGRWQDEQPSGRGYVPVAKPTPKPLTPRLKAMANGTWDGMTPEQREALIEAEA